MHSGPRPGTGRVKEYGYDSDLDTLTCIDYNDGLSGETPSWTYDAAGNRSNSGYTYDALNRMTASPGSHTYVNDILGNRLYRDYEATGSVKMEWDEAARMTQCLGPSDGPDYSYRADGMRTRKVSGHLLTWHAPTSEHSGFYDENTSTNFPTYRYRYDGQMCCEDDYTVQTPGEPPTVTITGNAYALGARGIDMIRPFTVNSSILVRTYSTANSRSTTAMAT